MYCIYCLFLAHLSTKCSRWVIVIAFCPKGVVRCASSVNILSSVTSQSIGMRRHRKHPLNDLTRIPSNVWDLWQPNEKNFKILLLLNWLPHFQTICRNVPWMTLYHIYSSHVDWSKIMASRGRSYFTSYGSSENLKKILRRKCSFSNNVVEMFLGRPSIRFLLAKLIGWNTYMAVWRCNFCLKAVSEKKDVHA